MILFGEIFDLGGGLDLFSLALDENLFTVGTPTGRLIYPWVLDGGFIYDEIHGGYVYDGTPRAAPDQVGIVGLRGSSAITKVSKSETVT